MKMAPGRLQMKTTQFYDKFVKINEKVHQKQNLVERFDFLRFNNQSVQSKFGEKWKFLR